MKKDILENLKTGANFIKIGVGLWIIETIYFLIDEGWHFKATSDAEIAVDALVSIIYGIGICHVAVAIYHAVKSYAKNLHE